MKTISRNNFLKKACFTGICMCGFSSVALSGKSESADQSEETPDGNQLLIQTWISNLLSNLDQELDEEAKRSVLKSCSMVHYENLKMDDVLLPYIGNLEGFIGFLEEKWGWKVEYNKTEKTVVADENKNYCVCPMINKDNENKSAICFCSEGFAEKMFSVVAGVSAKATVISSIQRGDERCIYKIDLDS